MNSARHNLSSYAETQETSQTHVYVNTARLSQIETDILSLNVCSSWGTAITRRTSTASDLLATHPKRQYRWIFNTIRPFMIWSRVVCSSVRSPRTSKHDPWQSQSPPTFCFISQSPITPTHVESDLEYSCRQASLLPPTCAVDAADARSKRQPFICLPSQAPAHGSTLKRMLASATFTRTRFMGRLTAVDHNFSVVVSSLRILGDRSREPTPMQLVVESPAQVDTPQGTVAFVAPQMPHSALDVSAESLRSAKLPPSSRSAPGQRSYARVYCIAHSPKSRLGEARLIDIRPRAVCHSRLPRYLQLISIRKRQAHRIQVWPSLDLLHVCQHSPSGQNDICNFNRCRQDLAVAHYLESGRDALSKMNHLILDFRSGTIRANMSVVAGSHDLSINQVVFQSLKRSIPFA